jgi:DNA polymerase-1
VLEQLKPFLENAKYGKIGQNLKYDWNILRMYGLHPQGILADTMVAAYLLDPEGRKNLKALAARYLEYTVLSYEEVCGQGKEEICFDQVDVNLAARYSAEDAWIAVRLWEQLKPKLEAEKLMTIFNEIELPLIGILSSMEHEGVCIDVEWLRQLSGEFEKELKTLEERVYAYSKEPVNLNSPKQLALFLFEELKLPVQSKTKTGWSTDAQVLESLTPLHEVPRLLLEYREISKLKGTYVEPLSQVTDEKKIHAHFHQTVTATGRLSSSDPNLQNIPIRSTRGMKIRRAFVPSDHCILLSADYSQIELRLLAHLSQDSVLLHAFQEDYDVHQQTASDLFQLPLDQVNDEQRAAAKAINFGLMYGKTAFGLSQELKIPRKQAQEMIDQYFTKYQGVKRYLEEQVQLAREQGWVRTLSGRKRWLPDIQSKNMAIRNNSERMAKNTPIQGTAADLMKLAMIRIDEALLAHKLQAKMTIQVHDEIVLDVPQEELSTVMKLVQHAMESAMSLSVPLQVNVMVGKNWMDCVAVIS